MVALGHSQEVFLPSDVSLLDFAGYFVSVALGPLQEVLRPRDVVAPGLRWPRGFLAALGHVQEVLPRDAVAPGLRGHLFRFLLAFCFQELCVSISCHYGLDSLVLHTCGPLATLAADGFLKLWRSISLALCARDLSTVLLRQWVVWLDYPHWPRGGAALSNECGIVNLPVNNPVVLSSIENAFNKPCH